MCPYNYPYLKGNYSNPHPAIWVEIISPHNPSLRVATWAIVDSGIEKTCVPRQIILDLQRRKIREIGREEDILYGVYSVHIRGEDKFLSDISVIELPDLDYPLIGLDILNEFSVHLNGPSEVLTIT